MQTTAIISHRNDFNRVRFFGATSAKAPTAMALFFLIANSFALAQGILNFSNLNIIDPVTQRGYSAPVTLPDGEKAAGARFTAGLFLVQLQGLQTLATTPFRDGPAAGYFVRVFRIEVPGIPPGAPATFRARVWETAAGSYENAVASGQFYHGAFVTASGSELITVPALANPSGIPNLLPIPSLGGIQPLTLIPEPRITILFIFGIACLISQKIKASKHSSRLAMPPSRQTELRNAIATRSCSSELQAPPPSGHVARDENPRRTSQRT